MTEIEVYIQQIYSMILGTLATWKFLRAHEQLVVFWMLDVSQKCILRFIVNQIYVYTVPASSPFPLHFFHSSDSFLLHKW